MNEIDGPSFVEPPGGFPVDPEELRKLLLMLLDDSVHHLAAGADPIAIATGLLDHLAPLGTDPRLILGKELQPRGEDDGE